MREGIRGEWEGWGGDWWWLRESIGEGFPRALSAVMLILKNATPQAAGGREWVRGYDGGCLGIQVMVQLRWVDRGGGD